MNDNILPLGSVVKLKKAQKPIVVIGYLVKEDGSPKVWDYLACPYPIGVLDMEKNFVFQKEQIEKIIFKGYIDEAGQYFLDQMKELKKDLK